MARRVDQVRELQALIDAQSQIRDQQSQLAQAGVRRAFEQVTDFRDPKQTRRAVTEAVKVVQAAQRRTASVADGYMARSTSAITGRRANPIGAVDVRSLRRKLPQDVIEQLASGRSVSADQARRSQSKVEAVPAEEVYGRIPDSIRFASVAKGKSEEQARLEGLRRAMTVADTDVMLAERAQVQQFLVQNKPKGVVGYRRILHPELGSGGPPCGLCVVASDRLYHVEDLMPIHARCRCSVAVATADSDPGDSLNKEDLALIYKAAGGNTRNQLKTVRVEYAEHGELGPVIVNATQNFRGPDDFARTQSQDQEKNWFAELETLQENLERLAARSGESDDVDEAIRWNGYKIRELNARLP